MPISHYYSNGRGIGADSERDLYQDLVDESIFLQGINFQYCPRKFVALNRIMNEDKLSAFDKHYTIEMVIMNVDGYGENHEFLSKFGVYLNKSLKLQVSKRKFQQITGEKNPLEGDLIYFSPGKALFEILHLEDETPFYMIGRNYTYTLTCELYKYSQETLNTEDEEIDRIEDVFKNENNVEKDPFQRNTDFDFSSDFILDKSEKNPLGDK